MNILEQRFLAWTFYAIFHLSSACVSHADEQPKDRLIYPGIQKTESREHFLDYRWASEFHQLIDAIEAKDLARFREFQAFVAEQKYDATPAQLYERDLLLWFFSRHSDSPATSVAELKEQWDRRSDRKWSWDTLLAFNDVLKRLPGMHESFQMSVWTKLEDEYQQIKRLHDQRMITNAELSRYGFRFTRRITDDEEAVVVCEQLLRKLPKNFSLVSVLMDRTNSLDHQNPDKWRERYKDALSQGRDILTGNDELVAQYPLALPKVFLELTRTQLEPEARLLTLMKCIAACENANSLLRSDETVSAERKEQHETLLSRLYASSILDGYRLMKSQPTDESHQANQVFVRAFRRSLVTDALQNLISQLGSSDLGEKVNAHLSLASVCFDCLTERQIKSPKELVSCESELVSSIDAARSLLKVSSVALPLRLEASIDRTELSWLEWHLINSLASKSKQGDPIVSDQENGFVVTDESVDKRLSTLSTRGSLEISVRARTALGNFHLIQGNYQDAIDALAIEELDFKFRAAVIRCLAYKDSGDLKKAKEEHRKIKSIDTSNEIPVLRESMTWITEFLKAEISLANDALKIESIKNLKALLSTSVEGPSSPSRSLAERLQVSNQHHEALYLRFSGGKSENAIDIWKRHKDGPNSSFVRARAAYYLLETVYLKGTKEIEHTTSELKRRRIEYNGKLKTFKEPPNDSGDTRLYQELVDMKEEFAKERSALLALQASLLADDEVRRSCIDVVNFAIELDKSGQYPNLRYNSLCLVLRLYNLSPSETFKAELEVLPGWSLKRVAQTVCEIGIKQRRKISSDDVFKEDREELFQRYRDGFDLAVEFGVLENDIEWAARVAAATSNQSINDLAIQVGASKAWEKGFSLPVLPQKPFVSFYVGLHRTHVFWRVSGVEQEISHHAEEIQRSEVVSWIEKYVTDFLSRRGHSADVLAAFSDAVELCNRLFCDEMRDDFKKAQSNATCIYVIPHGPLFQVPLDTLPIGGSPDAGKYLANECPPFIYLPSSTRFSDRPSRSRSAPPVLLTIQPGSDVGKESKAIAELFAGLGSVRLNPSCEREDFPRIEQSQFEGTGEALITEMAKGYRFIHIGCHGVGRDGGKTLPDGANLKLWESGSLSAGDLLKNFPGGTGAQIDAELVFLSACETQVSDAKSLRYGGNTVKAMGTAFLLAGAENVIASHWKVFDDSTQKLAEQLMNQIKLRSASESISAEEYAVILHSSRKWVQEKFPQPCDWGPFTLSTFLTSPE